MGIKLPFALMEPLCNAQTEVNTAPSCFALSLEGIKLIFSTLCTSAARCKDYFNYTCSLVKGEIILLFYPNVT
jgi:hypothetical protein